jgi:hypothetical protein
MEPTRPTVCAIMTPRRAAHLNRYAANLNTERFLWTQITPLNFHKHLSLVRTN